MKKILTIIIFFVSLIAKGQTVLTIENIVTVNTDAVWYGIDITRSTETTLTYRNNTITSQNTSAYMLQAGDESVVVTNNNLDGAVITGNKLSWVGDKMAATVTHGIFTGYNIDVTIKYNYIDVVPMGIVRKSNGMTDVNGSIAYNIFRSPEGTAIAIKGMNGVRVYNNTFYSSNVLYTGPGVGTWRGLIDVYANDSPVALSTGTKIKNNVFYTVNQIYNIYVYEASGLTGFESDYNVFYCEAGTPMFRIGSTNYTFAQWQALGYDAHSVVINPTFADTINFVPAYRLSYGTDLGVALNEGLAATAVWGSGDPATNIQETVWQAGAVVLSGSTYYVSTTGNNANAGTIAAPWATWQYGFSQIVAGDTLYIRGGTYQPTETVFSGYDVGAYAWANDGTANNLITVLNYPGETPIMNATNVDGSNTSIGLYLHSCDYWYIKGLTIQNCPGFGMEIQDGTNTTIEQCKFTYNISSGFRVFGASDDVTILNCDAYHNQDEVAPGGPDGFEASNITYRAGDLRLITFRGCRSWDNSDDGFDHWNMEGYLVIDKCWAWRNGWTEGGLTGDGDGFKLGTVTTDMAALFSRTVTNCLAFNNRLWGISQNQALTKMYLYNNTVYNNGNGINLYWGDLAHVVRNNASFLNADENWNGAHTNAVISDNTYDDQWQPLGPVATSVDFISIISTGVYKERKSDGSLPDINFLHLLTGSDLINAGLDIGIPYSGSAPDLGAFEYSIKYIMNSGKIVITDNSTSLPIINK